MIEFFPIAGLCNRMRSIISAINLGQELKRKVRIHWWNNNELNCSFEKLFEPLVFQGQNIEVISYEKKPDFLNNHRSRLIIEEIPKINALGMYNVTQEFKKNGEITKKDFTDYDRIYISSLASFYSFKNTDYKIFKPVSRIQLQIEKWSSKFDRNTIGLHIRRTDNWKGKLASPTILFEKKMREELASNSDANFFIACDDLKTKRKLEQEFKEKIITNLEETDRVTVNGMESSMLDLFLLSRTKHLYGTYFSSFSNTSAIIGNIEKEILFKNNWKKEISFWEPYYAKKMRVKVLIKTIVRKLLNNN